VTLEWEIVERTIEALPAESTSGKRARAALRLCANGLTPGEITSLRRADVRDLNADLDRAQDATVTIAERPIGNTVALIDTTSHALRQWLRVAPASEWLLCTYTEGKAGRRMTDSDIRAACDRAAQRARIDAQLITPTALREAYAVRLAEAGVPPETLAAGLGLVQVRSVERFYHVAPPTIAAVQRHIGRQPTLAAHASEQEVRALRKDLDELRAALDKRDAAPALAALGARLAEAETNLADLRRLLDARTARIEQVEDVVQDLLANPWATAASPPPAHDGTTTTQADAARSKLGLSNDGQGGVARGS